MFDYGTGGDCESLLIYDVTTLGLDRETEALAVSLMQQTDMPIVFWINSECDLNYRGRHPEQKNNYWVVIRPQESYDEVRRLVLAGIYTAIQERKRYWKPCPLSDYLRKLTDEGNKERIEVYYALCGNLESTVASLDVEWFLGQYGIKTSDQVHQVHFLSILEKLKEYVELHSPKKHGARMNWYRELRISNLLTYACYYRRGGGYRLALAKYLNAVDVRYLPKVEKTAQIISKNCKKYESSEDRSEFAKDLYDSLIPHFHMEDMIGLEIQHTKTGEHPTAHFGMKRIYSYVPEDLPGQDELMLWLRKARELIVAYRDKKSYEIPDVTFNLIDSEEENAYADGNKVEGYCISFSTAFIRNRINEIRMLPVTYCEGLFCTEDEFREAFLRHVIYFVTAHEYGHILNGDCDRKAGYSPEKERLADETACELIKEAITVLYRFPPYPTGEREKLGDLLRDGDRKKLFQSVSSERLLQITKESCDLQRKLQIDAYMMVEAKRFVDAWRNCE